MPILDLDDPAAFVWRRGLNGKLIKVLADGVHAVRVRMTARDSNTVAGQIAADRSWVTDATGDSGIGLRRPGSRFAADSATYDETARAYQEMVANTARAWIDGPAHVVPEHTPPDTAGTAPAWHSDISFSDAEAIKAEARAAAAREQAAAWRNLRTL